MLIGDRERVAIDAVAGSKLALEVGRPEIIRCRRRRPDHPWMRRGAPVAPALHEPATREEVRHGASDRPVVNARMPSRQDLEQFARPPEGVRFSFVHEELGHRVAEPVGAVMGRATPIRETAPALRVVASEPLVPHAPTHPIAGTELTHGEAITLRHRARTAAVRP